MFRKKICFYIVALTLLLGCCVLMAGEADTAKADLSFGGGTGQLSDPYRIATADDLYTLARDVNDGKSNGYYGKYFTLVNAIDLAGISAVDSAGWFPIGHDPLYPFKGTFYGNGYEIGGLRSTRPDADRVGLFGVTSEDALIEGLIVSGEITGKNYTGGIVGYNLGRIENCISRVAVRDQALSFATKIGGIAGSNAGMIFGCGNEGPISVHFTITGGIAGNNIGTVDGCYNTAEVSSADSIVGGIVGFNENGSVTQCFNTGRIGGDTTVGGIAGANAAIVANAYNTGAIESVQGTAAGICGSNEEAGAIYNSFHMAVVSGRFNTAAISGYNVGTVTNSFSASDRFDGEIANGGVVLNCDRLTIYEMIQPDILTGAMAALATETGLGFWSKREYDDAYCYLPELTFFTDKAVALPGLGIERIAVGADEVHLDKDSFVYTGWAQEPAIVYGGMTLKKGKDYTAFCTDNIEYGTASIEITFIRYYRGVFTKTFSITKLPLELSWDQTPLIYDGTQQHPIATVIGSAADSGIALAYSFDGCVSAGEWTVTALLPQTETGANYYITNPTIDFTIEKRPITLAWAEEPLVYNATCQYPLATVDKGRVNEEIITLRYEMPDAIAAGVYAVTAFLAETSVNANYSLPSQPYEYEIGKKTIGLLWDSTPLYYNGRVQYPTAEVDGAVGEEKVTLRYAGYETAVDANETEGYRVTAYLTQNPINVNYLLPPLPHTYFILRNPLIAAWWDDILYYTGEPQCPGYYIESGRIGRDEVVFEVSDFSGNIDASSGNAYSVTLTLKDDTCNKNYSFAGMTKQYDIAKATFDLDSVKFRSKAFLYNGRKQSILVETLLPKGITVEYEGNGRSIVGDHTVRAIFSADQRNYCPLTETTLTAHLYIVQTAFEDKENDLHAEIINGDVRFGISPRIVQNARTKAYAQKRKTVSRSYDVDFVIGTAKIFFNGTLRIRLRLTDKEMKRTGIEVWFFTDKGVMKKAESRLLDGTLVFDLFDATGFAVTYRKSTVWIPWVAGSASFLAAAVVVVFLLWKRNKRKIRVPIGPVLETAVSEQDVAEQTQFAKAGVPEQKDTFDRRKPFVVDEVWCRSYQWFERGLGFKDADKQKAVCAGDASMAKLYESKPQGVVYWKGRKIKRGSQNYMLLEQAVFDALCASNEAVGEDAHDGIKE